MWRSNIPLIYVWAGLADALLNNGMKSNVISDGWYEIEDDERIPFGTHSLWWWAKIDFNQRQWHRVHWHSVSEAALMATTGPFNNDNNWMVGELIGPFAHALHHQQYYYYDYGYFIDVSIYTITKHNGHVSLLHVMPLAEKPSIMPFGVSGTSKMHLLTCKTCITRQFTCVRRYVAVYVYVCHHCFRSEHAIQHSNRLVFLAAFIYKLYVYILHRYIYEWWYSYWCIRRSLQTNDVHKWNHCFCHASSVAYLMALTEQPVKNESNTD